MIHDTLQGDRMGNDPNQWLRDRGLGQFIPPQVSSMSQAGNAGMNAKRAGYYANTPSKRYIPDNLKQDIDKPGFDAHAKNPAGMTPEQKSAWMAQHGDSAMPSSTYTGKPAKKQAAAVVPPPGVTLAQHLDGIKPAPVAKPTVTVGSPVLGGKTPPGVSAILGAATGATGSAPKFPTAPSYQGPTEKDIQAGRKAAQDRIAGYERLAKDWTDASPEEREAITRGMSFNETADFAEAIKDESRRRYGEAVDKAHSQRDAADVVMRATQEARSQRDREFRKRMIERDAEITRLSGEARAAYRNSEQNTRDRQFESDKRFSEAMAESPLSKVFSRKNPFGAGVSKLGRWFSSRPGMQDILPYTTE